MIECPYIKEANQLCNVLINEVVQADTWTKTQDAVWAIQCVRSKAKKHIAEWGRLNNSSLPKTNKQPLEPTCVSR
jgi:hypothetical protein